MSEGRRPDNLRKGPELPTAAERAKSKGPPSKRDFAKAAYVILFAGIGGLLLMLTLLLWPNVPPGEQAAVISFVYSAPFGYLLLVAFAGGVAALGYRMYLNRQFSKVQETQGITERTQTAPSPRVEPVRPRPAPPATTGAVFVKCRLCPQTYRADLPEGEPWITLLNHVFEHYKELAYVRDEYPNQDFMYEIMHKWYEEIKQ